MNTTKELLKNQTNHLNELLKQIGVDMGLTVSYGNGKPSLTAYEESRTISIALSKPELQSTISGITNILNEINRVQREQKRNTEPCPALLSYQYCRYLQREQKQNTESVGK